jgi:hypothetical protein
MKGRPVDDVEGVSHSIKHCHDEAAVPDAEADGERTWRRSALV